MKIGVRIRADDASSRAGPVWWNAAATLDEVGVELEGDAAVALAVVVRATKGLLGIIDGMMEQGIAIISDTLERAERGEASRLAG